MSHSLNARCQDHGHVPHPDRGCAEGCGTHGVTDVPCWRECPDWAGLSLGNSLMRRAGDRDD